MSRAVAAKTFSVNRDNLSKLNAGESGGVSPLFYGLCEPDETGAEAGLDTETQTFTVDPSLEGHRLDFVVSRLLGISRGFAQKLIKTGAAELTPQRRVKPSIKVQTGDVLAIKVPPAESLELEPEDINFEVVYSDPDIAVINKPAGLVVHPSPGHWTGTLVHGLLNKFPDLGTLNGVKRPGIVHRLDSTTSGLMVIAKNGLAQEGLFREFKERRVEKEYLALAWGTLRQKSGTIDLPIARDPYNRLRMTIIEDGRESRTDYRVLWSGKGYSLVRCRLHSGRTHQIRVHMRAVGHPLVGDRLYAPERKSPFGEPRVFLHAWRLAFKHPRSGEILAFSCPLPEELSSFLKDILSKKADQR